MMISCKTSQIWSYNVCLHLSLNETILIEKQVYTYSEFSFVLIFDLEPIVQEYNYIVL